MVTLPSLRRISLEVDREPDICRATSVDHPAPGRLEFHRQT
jgi:hypothetical protein